MTITKVGIVGEGEAGQELLRALEKRDLPVVSLSVHEALGPLADCDLVIECVPDQPGEKQEVLRRIETHISPGAVLATDTSAPRLADLADAVERPEQLLSLRFFFESALRAPHVELHTTPDTAPGVRMTVQAFCRQVGWTPLDAAVDAAE